MIAMHEDFASHKLWHVETVLPLASPQGNDEVVEQEPLSNELGHGLQYFSPLTFEYFPGKRSEKRRDA